MYRPIPSKLMHEVNVGGTAAVIAACRAAGVGTLVYTSSLEVVSGMDEFGRATSLNGLDEAAPIPFKHHLPYATTKAEAERMVLAAHSPLLQRPCEALRRGHS